MKKVVTAFVVALLTFIVLNFFYSNLGGTAFNYPLSFEFRVPGLFNLKSLEIPLGFVMITVFCLGMIFLPVLQMIPALFRNAEIRSREKRIRELERELEAFKPGQDLSSSPSSSDL